MPSLNSAVATALSWSLGSARAGAAASAAARTTQERKALIGPSVAARLPHVNAVLALAFIPRHHSGALTRRGAFGGAVVIFATAACRQIVGIGDEPPGAGVCGAFPWAGDACHSCIQASCCAQATACRSEATCAAAFDCIAACAAGDERCRSKCVAYGDDAMAALGSCQSRSCTAACGLQCGGWGLLPGPQFAHIEATSGCEGCLTTMACDYLASCVADEGCLKSRFCGNACVPFDWDCQSNCGYPYPSTNLFGNGAGPGVPSNTQLLAGAQADTPCAEPCQSGNDWSCVGSARWPKATSDVTHRLRISEYPGGMAVAGATVSACALEDDYCVPDGGGLLASSMTLSDGTVSLAIPESPLSFSGYFELRNSAYATTLLFRPAPAESSSSSAASYEPQALLSEGEVMALYGQIHVQYDQNLGSIAVIPADCEGIWAPGVTFDPLAETGDGGCPDSAPDARDVPFYLDANGYPQPQCNVRETQRSGRIVGGGFASVPPGRVTITSHEPNGSTFNMSTVLVRTDTITVVYAPPTP